MENTLENNYKQRTLEKIKQLKYGAFGHYAIKCRYLDQEFEIILLTAQCAKDQELMELLGRWRKENEHWYLAQFPVTTERTTQWFLNKLIEVEDRMLFIIKISAKFIGHVGLFRFDFSNSICEIDNIVRGEKDCPGIMQDAVRGLMDWAKAELRLRGFSLKVLSDNLRAIKFYEQLGYKEVSRVPLIQINGQNGPEWTEAPDDYKKEVLRYYVIMESI